MPNGPSPDPRSGSVEERQRLERDLHVHQCVCGRVFSVVLIQVYSDVAVNMGVSGVASYSDLTPVNQF